MEQKDYLLREIEKIGLVLRAILNRITGSGENLALTIEDQFIAEKELLFTESGIDSDKLMSLNESETNNYIASFRGMNVTNIECLADILRETGLKIKSENANLMLQKALELYNTCSSTDKTFSFEREDKMNEIKNALQ
ncbi:MAG: hypothetical protein HOO86_11475 [Bacteroidales bacterium]|nr:hypothetical protein [Bacteroidales bacterium]